MDRDPGGPRLVRAEARGRRRGLPHERARRVRRRPPQGRLPRRRRRRLGQAVHAHLRGRRQRRVHARSRAGTRSPPGWPTWSCAWPRRRCPPASRTRRARSSRSSTTSWNGRSGPNLLWIFALEMQRYMQAYGLDKRDIAQVAVKNKRNAADHPAALLGQADITVEDVLASETLAWPVQRLDVSPISDGAVAIVMASEDAAKRLTDRPVWVQGVGWNLDTTYWTNRDLAYPEYVENAARMAYGMAGVNEPRKEIHVAEPYDPFDYKELHHLEGLLLFDRGKAPEAAARRRDRPGRGPPVLPVRRSARRREPDRRCRADEDRRALLAAPRRGRRPPGPGDARARRRPGVGRPDAGRDRGRDGERRAGRSRRPRSRLRRAPRATSLSDQEFRSATGAVEQRLDTLYEWDPGEAIGAFLDGLREQRILATTCISCGRTLVPAAQVLRAMLPADRRLDRGAADRHGRDVLDLSRHLGHATAGRAADPGGDPARRHERGRLPPPPRRGRSGRRPCRDAGRGGLEAGRRAGRVDPGHRVFPAAGARAPP